MLCYGGQCNRLNSTGMVYGLSGYICGLSIYHNPPKSVEIPRGIMDHQHRVQQFMYDTHVCFELSNFMWRCLKRWGFTSSLVYLDDFLVLGKNKQECLDAQLMLISILRSLGFYISWKKCVSPTQNIVFLGVQFDFRDMSVSLPKDKLKRLYDELEFFVNKTRASIRQVQRLCGVLSHCAKVVKGGKTFSQRVFRLLKAWPDSQKRIRLSTGFKHNVFWLKQFAASLIGRT